MKWLLSNNRLKLAAALSLSVVAYLFAGALMFTSGYMISLAATLPLTVLALHLPSIFVRIFGIGKPPIQYAYRLSSHDWVLRMTSRLRLCLYEALRKKTGVLQSRERTGKVLSMLTDDIGHAQDAVLRGVLPVTSAWLLALSVMVLTGIVSPLLAAALIVLLAISCVIVPLAVARCNADLMKEMGDKNDLLYEALVDNAHGIVEWIMSARRSDFIDGQARIFTEKSEIGIRIRSHRRACELASQVLFCLCVLAIVIWASFAFAPFMQGTTDSCPLAVTDFAHWMGDIESINASPYPANWIAAFALFFFPLTEALLQVEQSVETIDRQSRSVNELIEYMGDSARISVKDLADIDRAINLKACDDCFPFDINLDGVSFSYGDAKVLDEIDLQIPYGSKIAIVGKSGAGKTTLVSIIHGDLEPDSGSVTIGQTSPSRISGGVHQVVGVVGQFPYLFDMTLRENLLIAKPNASDLELEEALELVGLEETRRRLPAVLDTRLTEQGMRFSGGERHRIALARILLARQPVIMLDEPFANLDAQTEMDLLDTLFEVFSDNTLIVVTHHQRGLDRFDRVIRL